MSEVVDQITTPVLSEPLAGVAVATMFRGEPAQLLQWCNFHLNAGTDQLYVVLDCPTQIWSRHSRSTRGSSGT